MVRDLLNNSLANIFIDVPLKRVSPMNDVRRYSVTCLKSQSCLMSSFVITHAYARIEDEINFVAFCFAFNYCVGEIINFTKTLALSFGKTSYLF